jgi:tetratricopeptide (TPR) repeat protein
MKNQIFNWLIARRVSCWLAGLLATFVLAGQVLAADVSHDFSTANEFYARGKYVEAAAAYETILRSGTVSANLLFNYGNAEFKAGNLGKAIAAFRRAELLAPRDSEIRANLNFARNQVQGSAAHEQRWQDSLGQLSLNEWTLLAALAFWGVFLLFAFRQLRPALVPKLKMITNLAILVFFISGAALAVQAADHFSNSVAVVTAPGVSARSGPFDDAQDVFVTHDGAELSVISRHDDWVQVADGTGKVGWLNQKQAQVLPGA